MAYDSTYDLKQEVAPICQKENLTKLLRGLLDLLSEVANCNREFGDHLGALLDSRPRGTAEFIVRLRDQMPAVLHSIVRHPDMDAGRQTAKWNEAEKLVAFITEYVAAPGFCGANLVRKP